MDAEIMRRELGARIKSLRLRAGFKQVELAAKLGGVSPNLLSNWEQGYSAPNIFLLHDLADALHCSLYELLGCAEPVLSADEIAFLQAYRALDDNGKHTVWAVIDSQFLRITR